MKKLVIDLQDVLCLETMNAIETDLNSKYTLEEICDIPLEEIASNGDVKLHYHKYTKSKIEELKNYISNFYENNPYPSDSVSDILNLANELEIEFWYNGNTKSFDKVFDWAYDLFSVDELNKFTNKSTPIGDYIVSANPSFLNNSIGYKILMDMPYNENYQDCHRIVDWEHLLRLLKEDGIKMNNIPSYRFLEKEDRCNG